MKYWGKKPHNIWAQYIERYTPPSGIVADPFAGSAVAAFEAVKLGRKAIAFDLNPLSAFIIEVTASASKFNEKAFRNSAARVKEAAESTDVYQKNYRRTRDGQAATVLNYRWEDGRVVGVAFQPDSDESRILVNADEKDRHLARRVSKLSVSAWHPTRRFPAHPSITHRFLAAAGGGTIDCLWTRRNLYLLACLFKQISSISDNHIRLQLLSAFVQTLHLCCKMVIPRHEEAERDFSGSWGRPDYMIRRRQMEQNPVDVFWRSCTGRQGVLPMMLDAVQTFPNGVDIHDARAAGKLRMSADINYGSIDIADFHDYVKPKSVDFVITDPPYAGLVRYLPLSVLWLCWLEHLDKKYKPELRSEISVEKNSAPSRENYRLRLRNAFEELHTALCDDGRLVVTFHHQQVREFNDFVLAVKGAGFFFEKVTHQYNRRSGESNVANPYGVSGSDFYVRCVKRRDMNVTDKAGGLERFIVVKAIEIIGQRNEQTPYNFLFEALWPELLQAGFTQPKDSSDEIRRVLSANEGSGRIFVRRTNPDARIGDFWWFNEPSKYISHPDRPLAGRVAESVLSLLRRRVSVKLDDVIGELFREYPNGLTPDPRTVHSYLEQYAFPSQGKWKISPATIIASTRHSDMIASILAVGSKMGVSCFVGRREQPEQTSSGKRLRDLADVPGLGSLQKLVEKTGVERLEMVDVIFLPPDRASIVCLWEVENSTNFSSAIQRGSNAPKDTPKFMVVPDDRENELLAIIDPLFVQSFGDNHWRYLTYTDIARLASFSSPTLGEILNTSKPLGKGHSSAL
jgi:16S rRNA G966 N2-methylase RsmD